MAKLTPLLQKIADMLPEGWLLVPEYPTGEVAGPCVCGSWPGGKCFQCPVAPPRTHEVTQDG